MKKAYDKPTLVRRDILTKVSSNAAEPIFSAVGKP
jgi:hypothetical protein